jgi:enoyl-CoA hydratase/carnithine racemase
VTADPPHPPLRLERDGHVVSLILNRAERANAFTEEMWEGLPALVEQAGSMAADGARVLAVRSAAERAFSAGADLEEYRTHADDAEWGLGNHDRVTRALDSVRDSALPTVAVIAGACVGGGAGLAVACDLRVCSDDSVFAITPARLGLVYPYADTLALVQLIGTSAARRMLLTGARFDAEWALRVGLVDVCVPRADLAAATDTLVGELAAASPVAVRGMRSTIRWAAAGRRPDEPLVASAATALVRESLESADHREGTAAFLERRPPAF